MRKIVFYTTVLIFASNVVAAQNNVTIKEGPAFTPKEGGYIGVDDIIGQDDNAIYCQNGTLKMIVRKYNKQKLNCEYATELELGAGVKKEKAYPYTITQINFAISNGEVLVIYDMWNKDTDIRTVYTQTVSKTGVLSKERKELQSCTYNKPYFVYHFNVSKDFSKVVVRQLQENISYTIYDTKTLKQLLTKPYPQEYKGEKIGSLIVKDILANNDIKIEFYTGSKDKGDYKEYTRILRATDGQIADLKQPPVLDDSKYVYSQEKIITPDNKTVIGGMYVQKIEKYNKKDELMTGTFLAIIDNSNKIINESYNLLDKDVYDKLTYKIKDDNGKNKTPGEKKIACESVVEMNGSYYVICPHAYTLSITQGNATKSINYQREIIVSKYNSQGKYEWMRIIPKLDRDAGSHDFMKKDGKLYFFYLENDKDKDMDMMKYNPDDISETRLSNGNMTCTTLDEQGTMKKQILPYPKDKGNTYKPQNWKCFLYGDNDLLTEYIDKGGKLAVITLK